MQNFSKEFIDKLINKDTNAFNKFYIDTVDIFYRYLKGNYFLSDEDSQDLVSTLYLKIWNGLENFKKDTNFSSWVWTIFRNTIIDFFKKDKLVNFSDITKNKEGVDFDEMLEDNIDISDFFDKKFNYEKIIKAIGDMEDIYKEVIFLKFVEDKSYDEISEILNISNDNVRKRLSRGLQNLRTLLGDK